MIQGCGQDCRQSYQIRWFIRTHRLAELLAPKVTADGCRDGALSAGVEINKGCGVPNLT